MSSIEFSQGMRYCPHCEDEYFLDYESKLAEFLSKGDCTTDSCECNHRDLTEEEGVEIYGEYYDEDDALCMGWYTIDKLRVRDHLVVPQSRTIETYSGELLFERVDAVPALDYIKCPGCGAVFNFKTDAEYTDVYGCSKCHCLYNSETAAENCLCGPAKEPVGEIEIQKETEAEPNPLAQLMNSMQRERLDEQLSRLDKAFAELGERLEKQKTTQSTPPRRDPFRRHDG